MRQSWPDALSAVRWACQVSGNPGRPYSSRMLDAWRDGGDSTDAAGQAGLVWRTLWELRGAPMATLVARAIPISTPCRCKAPCCSGKRINADWREAVDVIAAAALSAHVGPKGYELRVAILHRFYGQYHSYRQIARALSRDDAPLDDGTVARHGKEMKAWLGARESGDSSDSQQGIEPTAFTRGTELLRTAGLLDS